MCHGWWDDARVALESACLFDLVIYLFAPDDGTLALENRCDFLLAQAIENLLAAEAVGEEEHWVGNGACVVNLILLGAVAHGDGVGEEVAL